MNNMHLLARLDRLFSRCKDEGKEGAKHASNAAEDLRQFLRESADTAEDFAVATVMVLDPSKGVLEAAKESLVSQKAEGKLVRKSIFEVVDFLLTSAPDDEASKHAAQVVSECKSLFLSDQSASSRQAALLPIRRLLTRGPPYLPGLYFDPQQLQEWADALLDKYLHWGGGQVTAKSELLGTLGDMLELTWQVGQHHVAGRLASLLLAECRRALETREKADKEEERRRQQQGGAGGGGGGAGGADTALQGVLEALVPVVQYYTRAGATATAAEAASVAAALEAGYMQTSRLLCRLQERELKQYGPARAGLRLLTCCSDRLQEQLATDGYSLMQRLSALATGHSNVELKTQAMAAAEEVLRQLSDMMVASDRGEEEGEGQGKQRQQAGPEAVERRDMLRRLHEQLLGSFTGIVRSPVSEAKHVTFAVVGIGAMVAPARCFYGEQGVRALYSTMQPLADQGALSAQAASVWVEDRVARESALLRTLAALLREMTSTDEGALSATLSSAGRLLGMYLELYPRQQKEVRDVLAGVLSCLADQPQLLQQAAGRLAVSLLDLTLRPTVDVKTGPIAAAREAGDEGPTWRYYMPLWTSLLVCTASSSSTGEGGGGRGTRIPSPSAASVGSTNEGCVEAGRSALYDAMMQALASLVCTLDLGAGGSDVGQQPPKAGDLPSTGEGGAEGNDAQTEMVMMSADEVAFSLLAEFCTELLPQCGPQRFRPWAFFWTMELLQVAATNESLPGTYRLLRVAITLANQAGLLGGAPAPPPAAAGGGNGAGGGDVEMLDVKAGQRGGGSDGGGGDGSDGTGGETSYEEAEALLGVLRPFLSQLLAARRRSTGPLLLESLQLLLAVPHHLMHPKDLLPAVQTALRLGLHYPPLASVAMDALERWTEQAQGRTGTTGGSTGATQASPLDGNAGDGAGSGGGIDLAWLADGAAPLLEPYLSDLSALEAGSSGPGTAAAPASATTAAAAEGEGEAASLTGDVTQAGGGGVGGGADDDVSAAAVAAVEAVDPDEPSAADQQRKLWRLAAEHWQGEKGRRMQALRQLQPRIAAWLGCMGALALRALRNAAERGEGGGGGDRRWDPQDLLKLDIRIPGTARLMLALDSALPRAAWLAQHANDRQTRTAAAELLHAVVLWLLGGSAKAPESSSATGDAADPTGAAPARGAPSHPLLSAALPHAVRLAATGDPVAQQLFRPLVMGTVRWLTQSARHEGAATVALLDALMLGLCDEDSGALRMLCADACAEFLSWSVRHGTDGSGGSGRSGSNINSLMRRLYDRVGHPQPYYRLGAALAIERCAGTIVRDDRKGGLAATHLAECLGRLLPAVRAGEEDPPGTGAKEQAAAAIKVLFSQLYRNPQLIDLLMEGADTTAATATTATATAAAPHDPATTSAPGAAPGPGANASGGAAAGAGTGAAAAGVSSSCGGGPDTQLESLLRSAWGATAARQSWYRRVGQAYLENLIALEAVAEKDMGEQGSPPNEAPVAAWVSGRIQSCSSSLQEEARRLTPNLTAQPPAPLPGGPDAAGGGGPLLRQQRAMSDWLKAVEAACGWCSWAISQGIIQDPSLLLQWPTGTAAAPDTHQPSSPAALGRAATSAAADSAAPLGPPPVLPALLAFFDLLPPAPLQQLRGGGGAGGSSKAGRGGGLYSYRPHGRCAGCDRECRALTLTALTLMKQVLPHGVLPAGYPGLHSFLLCALCCPWELGFSVAEPARTLGLPQRVAALVTGAASHHPELAAAFAAAVRGQVGALFGQAPHTREGPADSVGGSGDGGNVGGGSGGGGVDVGAAVLGGVLPIDSPAGMFVLRGLAALVEVHLPTGGTTSDQEQGFVPTDVKEKLPTWLLAVASGLPANPPPRRRAAAEAALSLVVRLRVDPKEVLRTLLDPSGRGEAFYVNLSGGLHNWLIFNQAEACPALAGAVADPSQPPTSRRVAEMALVGALELLRMGAANRPTGDPRASSFLQALFPSLPQLCALAAPPPPQPPATADTTTAAAHSAAAPPPDDRRGSLLRVLGAMLPLGPSLVLNQAREAGRAVMDAYMRLLGTRSASEAPLRAEALRLLPFFLGGASAGSGRGGGGSRGVDGGGVGGGKPPLPPEAVERVVAAVGDLVDGCFPARSWDLRPGGSQSIGYAQQLVALADSAVQSAEQGADVTGIIKCMLPVLREMGEEPRGHMRQDALALRFARLAAAPWARGDAQHVQQQQQQGRQQGQRSQLPPAGGATQRPTQQQQQQKEQAEREGVMDGEAEKQAGTLVDFCWELVFNDAEQPAPLKRAVLLYLLLPLLQLAPLQFQIAVLHSRAALLLVPLRNLTSGGGGAAQAEEVLAAAEASGKLLQWAYESLPTEEVKAAVATVGETKGVMQLLKAVLMSSDPGQQQGDAGNVSLPGEVDVPALARSARTACFCAGCAAMSATQGDPGVFALLLKGRPKDADPSDPWAKMLPEDVRVDLNGGSGSGGDRDEVAASYSPGGGSSYVQRTAMARVQDEIGKMRAERRLGHRSTLGGTFGGTLGGTLGGGLSSLSIRMSASQFTDAGGLASLAEAAPSLPPPPTPAHVPAGRASSQGLSSGSEARTEGTAAAATAGTVVGPDWQDEDGAGGIVGAQGADKTVSPGPSDRLPTYLDALDKHPALLAAVRLVERASGLTLRSVAATEQGRRQLASGDLPDPLPRWMHPLLATLRAGDVRREVRLLVCKIVLHVEARQRQRNAERQQQQQQQQTAGGGGGDGADSKLPQCSIFGFYAHHWFPAMVEVLVPVKIGEDSEEAGGIHYMVLQGVMAWLSWRPVNPAARGDPPLDPALRPAAQAVMDYAAAAACSAESYDRRNNLRLITSLCALWRGAVSLPLERVQQYLQAAPPSAATAAGGGGGGRGGVGPSRQEYKKVLERRIFGMRLLSATLVHGQPLDVLSAARHRVRAIVTLLQRALESGESTRAHCDALGACWGWLLRFWHLLVARRGPQHHLQGPSTGGDGSGGGGGGDHVSPQDLEEAEEAAKVALRQMVNEGQTTRFLDVMVSMCRPFPAMARQLAAYLVRALQQEANREPASIGAGVGFFATAAGGGGGGARAGTGAPLALDALRRGLQEQGGAQAAAMVAIELRPVWGLLLSSRDPAVHHKLLLMAARLLPLLKGLGDAGEEEFILRKLLPDFWRSPLPDVRSAYLMLLRDAWGRRPDMHAVLQAPLLCLLGDPDPGLRRMAVEFWDARLPLAPAQRLADLLRMAAEVQEPWASHIHSHWPSAASSLLLECARRDERYNERGAMFPALADCKFVDMDIDTTAMQATFDFTATIGGASQSAFGGLTMTQGGGPRGPGFVRGTQATGPGGPRPLFTYANSISLQLPSSQDALWLGGPGLGGGGAAAGAGAVAGGLPTQATARLTLPQPKPKGRAGKGASRTAQIMAGTRRRLEQRRAAAALAGSRGLVLSRRYREGELPDVADVTLRAFAAPLGVLATRDSAIALALVQQLHRSSMQAANAAAAAVENAGIAGGGGGGGGGGQATELRGALAHAFGCRPSSTEFAAALQQLALVDRGMARLPAGEVLAAGHASGRLEASVLLLEEQLEFASLPGAAPGALGGDRDDGGPPRKQARIAPGPAGSGGAARHASAVAVPGTTDEKLWAAVAESYAALGVDDMSSSVYLHHVAACPGTKAGLEAAGNRAAEAAYELFDSLMQAVSEDAAADEPQAAALLGGEEPREAEEGLWFKARNDMLQALGDWQMLGEVIDGETDGQDQRLLVRDPGQGWDGPSFLRPFARCCLLQGADGRQRLKELADLSAQDEAKSSTLSKHCCVELAGVWAASGEWERCATSARRGLQARRAEWANTHPQAYARRAMLLLDMQQLAEVAEAAALGRRQHGAGGNTAMAISGGGSDALPDASSCIQALLQKWLGRRAAEEAPAECLAAEGMREAALEALGQGLEEQAICGQPRFHWVRGLVCRLQLHTVVCLQATGWLDPAANMLRKPDALLKGEQGGSGGGRWGLAMKADVAVANTQLLAAQVQDFPPRASILLPRLQASIIAMATVRGASPASPLFLPPLQQCAADLAAGDAHLCMWRHQQGGGGTAGGDDSHLSTALEAYARACVTADVGAEGGGGGGGGADGGRGETAEQEQVSGGSALRPLGVSAELAACVARASIKLASTCADLLSPSLSGGGAGNEEQEERRQRQEDATARVVEESGAGDLAALAVRHVLMGMQYGASCCTRGTMEQGTSPPALHLSRVLSLYWTSEEAAQEMASRWRTVPLASYLPWVAQMLSLLGDGPRQRALLPLLQALAAEYPQQVYFPYRLSRLHYDPAALQASAPLDSALRIPVLKDFSQALWDTCFPLQRWQHWEAELGRLLGKGDEDGAVSLWKAHVWPDMISRHQRPGGRDAGRRRPRYLQRAELTINQHFASKHATTLAEAFGEGAHKLRGLSRRVFLERCRTAQLSSLFQEVSSRVTGMRQLSSLSRWFEAFSSGSGGAGGGGGYQVPTTIEGAEGGPRLLLPSMPRLSFGGGSGGGIAIPCDVEVVGFGSSVHVYASKQQPKRLTMFGSDLKEYSFIVKGGEDLRMDQRVQQMTDLCNALAQGHPGAGKMQVATFDVVPLSPALGCLAALPDTKPLQDVMLSSSSAAGSGNDDDARLVTKEHNDLALRRYLDFQVSESGASKDQAQQWGAAQFAEAIQRMHQRTSRQAAIKGLREVQAAIPHADCLREALLRLSGGPESFLAMRAVYLDSLAAAAAYGWVAGVGDRHAQNILLDTRTGALVPIDFGYSFDTAVQALAVPELVPFRLTRSMAATLQPHAAQHLLLPRIASALAAVRSGADVLAGVFDLFLREPLEEWQREQARMDAARGRGNVAADAAAGGAAPGVSGGGGGVGGIGAEQRAPVGGATGTAQRKIGWAVRKLRGGHPSEIMIEQLSYRHGRAPYWPQLQENVRGLPQHNKRAARRMAQGGPMLSPEHQAECLLDQAMDPNLLARMWVGWQPWL